MTAWDAIAKMRQVEPRVEVPDGAITVMDFAERFGVSRSSAQEELNAMLHAGKMRRGKRPGAHKGYWYWPCE